MPIHVEFSWLPDVKTNATKSNNNNKRERRNCSGLSSWNKLINIYVFCEIFYFALPMLSVVQI